MHDTHAAGAAAKRHTAWRASSLPCPVVLSKPRRARRFAGRKAAPAFRCCQGRAARCDGAAAQGQPRSRHFEG
eukprot:scaffold42929_cov69-Phaeocystis_antarctica.AAC.2